MNRRMKIWISIISFLAVFLVLYYVADTTLKYKYEDGIKTMMDFYEYPEDSIDVLFLGSSHIGINIDTTQLCNDYGIASYKLWGPTQQLWNSYFYLKEALKTQKPKIVVLETLGMTHDIEYQGYAEAIKNTMGMKWSKDKYDAIMASFPKGSRLEVFFGFPVYHSRYKELTAEDFTSYFWNYKIGEKNTQGWYSVYVGNLPSTTKKEEALGEKSLQYFRKIVRICKDNDIPLVMVSMPYSIGDEEKSRLNTAANLISEYELSYLDLISNYQDYGIDFETDFGDSAGHLNSFGIAKATSIVGEYLTEQYDLPENYDNPYFAYNTPSDAKYSLLIPFEGDGSTSFIDTKHTLYDDSEKTWTIMAKIGTSCDSQEKVYFSCFSEKEPYRGLLVRLNEQHQLEFVLGNNIYYQVDLPEEKEFVSISIVKSKNNYRIYMDEALLTSDLSSECYSYDGTLIIGAEYLADQRIGKLSAVKVQKLDYYEKELSEKEIYQWMQNNEEVLSKEDIIEQLTEEYTGSIDYQLTKSFAGDGQSTYIDTGVQLYYDPKQCWTLLTELIVDEDGVYLSCFSEDETDYRGLLLRKVEDQIQIIVGSNSSVYVKADVNQTVTVAITKNDDVYQIYFNGALATTIESSCNQYIGTLLIGCERDPNYQFYRYSNVTVNRLQVIGDLLSEDEIMQW